VESYGKLPLAFEANQGQSDPQVKFLSRGAGYSLSLTSNEAVLGLHESSRQEPALPGAKARTAQEKTSREIKSAVLRMKLVGSNAKMEVTGQDELPGKSNYFIGNDPKKWHTNVRQFAKVRYENVYPGVDLVYYGHQRELEYDFVLQPGANPQAIRLGIEGARRLRLVHGDLVMTSAAGDVHLRSPDIYQETNGTRHEVCGRYVINGKNEVGFEVAAYDRRRALVIDPVLAYSTYLGGSYIDDATGIALDSAGNAYVTGFTGSNDFPTVNPIQPAKNYSYDAFVSKFNVEGTGLVYSTYLGGNDDDSAGAIALDSAGNAYVTGITYSTDFPTVNAVQATSHGNGDVFVTKIDAAGSALVYSTYLGGSQNDGGSGIVVDSAGNAYVTGAVNSTDFPTKNAPQPTYGGNSDAFVTKINAAGTALIYSTYLGGTGVDGGQGIAADSAGRAYVIGWTTSTDFPTKNPFQSTLAAGDIDAFVTKINAAGSSLVYSTYLGGSDNDYGKAIAVDSSGNAYVAGQTRSTDFPTVNPLITGLLGGFVSKFNAAGSALVYSTYWGEGLGIAVDTAGNAYVTGITSSANFPIVNAIQPVLGGGIDAIVSEINPQGSTLVYSTYLGGSKDDYGDGIAVDPVGSAYIVGVTYGKFHITPLAFQPLYQRNRDGFVAKIAQQTFVSVSPMKLAFRTVIIGTESATKKVTVTNRGSGTLTINKIYVGGLDPGDFSETNTCGNSLAAGANCTISVTFTPTTKGTKQGGIGISTPDPASPDPVALIGAGTVVSLSTAKLSFGDQAVGTTSPPQHITLTNTGNTQLNFKGVSITGTNPGDFYETNTCGTSIASKASCTITVTFKPTATGTRKAAVSIYDNGGGSPQKVTLTGTGT
jgi:hypothetical protein